MKILLKTLMFIVLSCLILVACQSSNPGSISQKYQEKDFFFNNINIQKVSSLPVGYIHTLKWEDGFIFAKVDQANWRIDTTSFEADFVNENDAILPNLYQTPTIPIHSNALLNDDEEIIGVSPYNELSVFVNKYVQPETQNTVDGEMPQSPQTVSIGLILSGQKLYLGKINSCGDGHVLWSKNNDFVFQNNCLFGEAWIYSNKLNQLNLIDNLGGFIYVHSLSPNKESLLYSIEGRNETAQFLQLYIIKLDDFTTQKFDVSIATPVEWLNDSTILVLYKGNTSHFFRLGVYDMKQNLTSDLLSLTAQNMIENKYIEWVSLSKDKKYFAFTTVIEPYKNSELWIGYFKNHNP